MGYNVKGERRNTGRTHFKKGSKPWNTGLKGTYKLSEETRKKMSNSHLNLKASKDSKKKMRISAIKRLEKQYNYVQILPTIGKYETQILDNLQKSFSYTILRQHKVAGYFLDGYCPAINLAIEIDEPRHKSKKYIEKDILREQQIKNELNCSFLRIPISRRCY